MRQAKNTLTALVVFSLAFCLFGTPVAFGAEQSGSTIESAPVDTVANDPPLADLADESDSASAGTNDGVASARSAEAVAASAADIEGFRATLTQAWYDMPEGNIDLSAYGLTLGQANKVWLEIQYDNPLIFWDGEGHWRMRDGIVTGYQNDWSYSKSDVDAMMAANGYAAETAKHAANDAQYDYNHTWPTYSAPAPKKPLSTYHDVANTDWYVADGTLDYVVQNGLMKGHNGLFRPSDAITRAEFATILWRYANPASAASYNTASARNTTAMADVESGSFYTEAANWCVAQGVITGVKTASGALFQPNHAVTREEAAAMLVRFAQQQGADIAPSAKNGASLGAFYDVQDCSSWAVSPLACAHEHGIISGSGNYLRPQDATTRCEAAALLKKTIELIEGPRRR